MFLTDKFKLALFFATPLIITALVAWLVFG